MVRRTILVLTASWPFLAAVVSEAQPSRLQYFGFAGGCDTEAYLQETTGFSNLCTVDLEDGRLLDRRWLSKMVVRDVKLVVATQEIFFEPVGEPVDGRQLWDLRPDYRQRWQDAVSGIGNALRTLAAVFFVADEPSWNGISRSELAAAHDEITSTLPWAVTVTSFNRRVDGAWFEGLDVPTDAVGYHHYWLVDPRTDLLYQSNLDLIKSHAHGKPFFYVMDAWWSPDHAAAGLQPEDMADVARNFAAMAVADTDAAGLVGFRWAATDAVLAARDLPAGVQRAYHEIGAAITGKCLGPDPIAPRNALFLLGCSYVATMEIHTDAGIEFAAAMPRERDYGTWVLGEGDVIGALKILDVEPVRAAPAFHTELPTRIRLYDTAHGRLVWQAIGPSRLDPEHVQRAPDSGASR